MKILLIEEDNQRLRELQLELANQPLISFLRVQTAIYTEPPPGLDAVFMTLPAGGWRTLCFFELDRFTPAGCAILRFFPAKGGRAQTSSRRQFYNPSVLPNRLVRYQKCGCFHFLTFSCYRRQQGGPFMREVCR
jgi:hypothetical protein